MQTITKITQRLNLAGALPRALAQFAAPPSFSGIIFAVGIIALECGAVGPCYDGQALLITEPLRLPIDSQAGTLKWQLTLNDRADRSLTIHRPRSDNT